MTSPLLALFIRSLREDSRLKFTYFSRAALVLLILLFLAATRSTLGWTNAPGLQFFGTVAHVDLWFVLLAGVSYFASAISEEKEEMTLGLLRMTNLNPLSILLGKSTSRLGVAALLFAAQFPFTLLAITLGGISLRQIVATFLTIGAFLFFVSNLALLASVVCRRTTGAAILTGVSLLVFFGIVPLGGWFAQVPIRLGWLPTKNPWTQTLTSVAAFARSSSPFSRVESVLTTRPLDRMIAFQVWSNLVLALAFFLLAWFGFEVFCGEQKESGPSRVGLARSIGRRRLWSPGRPWQRALAWKDFYFTTGGKLWIGIKLLVYGTPLAVVLAMPMQLGGPPTWEHFGFGTFWFMLLFIGVELSFAAAAIFRNERQGQTLSSLAMLPQGLRRVAYEKLLGVVPALAAAGTYLAVSLPLVAEPFRHGIMENGTYMDWVMLSYLASQGVFFLHLVVVFSLYVKRGALPLAIGCEVVIFILTGLFVAVLIRDVSGFILLTFFTLGATVFLHFHIGQRLAIVAAEG